MSQSGDSGTGGSSTPQEASCSACRSQISTYFEVSGVAVCESCKDLALAAHQASHVPTLLRGAALGTLAAAVGGGIYYAIAKATGYEFGLMSIILGLMVGFAVRLGSRGRGGWRYQALAVFLCYASICSTYVPRLLSALQEEKQAQAAVSSSTAVANPAAADKTDPVKMATPAPVASPEPQAPPTLGGFLKALAMFCALTLALPFLAGAQNLMGIVIIGIGLYEAWKVNHGIRFSMSGPFLVGEGRSG